MLTYLASSSAISHRVQTYVTVTQCGTQCDPIFWCVQILAGKIGKFGELEAIQQKFSHQYSETQICMH